MAAETAVGSSSYVAYVKETTWKTTPGTPAMRALPIVSESLDSNITSIESAEVRPDRQFAQPIQGNLSPQGDVNVEWNADALGYFLYYTFGTAPVVTGTGPYTHVIQQTPSVILPSLTIEKGFVDITTYLQYAGARVNRITFAVAPDALVTGAIGFMMANEVVATTPLDATLTDIDHIPFNSFDGSISEGGGVIGVATKLDLTIENQLNPLKVIGSQFLGALLAQRFKVTGTLEVFFENETLYQKFRNFTESAIVAVLQDQAGSSLTLDLKSVRYTGKTPMIPGEGPVLLSMPFAVHHDTTSGKQVVATVLNNIASLIV